MKKQNGITLIALVISIIVMLILAGVSINAVIGDNGVIGKAQDTLFLNSCAYLEEYFNQLYATCTMENVVVGDTPLHTLMKNGYQNYFFSTSEGACLKKVVVNEETGTNQTIVLYLVKKEQLPEEIRAQLTGAENLESRDYRKLRGCYGITSDLKAYYCENGLDTIMGLTKDDLNADSPDIVFAEEDSILAEVVNGGTAPVTNQGLKTIKRLTIDSIEKLSLLQDFSKFLNLTEVYFSGIEIPNLVGIEGAAYSINYIKFTNCNVQDYSALNSLTNLKQLYLVTPTGMNDEIIRLGSTDKGIASGKFTNLQYFGIVGNADWINNVENRYNSEIKYGITDISSLANFSDVTKKAIKYMNLQNLQLTSIASLEEFINVYLLRVECNALTTLEGIQNMSGLKYLYAPNQYSTVTSKYTLGRNEGDTANEADALRYIYKNNNTNSILYYVNLSNNTILKYVDSLGECTAIRYLYMSGCTNIQNASTMANTIGNCGVNMNLSSTYTLDVISESTQTVDLSNQTISLVTLESLEKCTNLWRLNLQNLKITDTSGIVITDAETIDKELNETLSKLTKMQYLKLYGIAGLSTMDFIGSGKITLLKELDLRGTKIVDLTCLNDYGTYLQNLLLDNSNIDLTTIQPTISRFTRAGWNRGSNYWSSGNGSGLMLYNQILYASLENCTNLTSLHCASYHPCTRVLDLSSCKKMTTLTGHYPSGLKISSSVTSHYSWNTNITKLDLSEAISLKSLELEGANVGNDYYLENWTTNSLKKCYALESLSFPGNSSIKGFKGLANLDSNVNYPLTSLSIFAWQDNYNCPAIDLTGLSNYTNLKYLTVSSSKTSDISPLALCSNLESLYLDWNYITDISSLGNLSKLKNLYLNNNTQLREITALGNCRELKYLNVNNCSIGDIYPLMNCTKLETLYIQNNTLNDFGYHTNSSGSTIGYEVMDVFYDLNHAKQGALKNLYISGNIFDDTEILLDLTWDGKSGF